VKVLTLLDDRMTSSGRETLYRTIATAAFRGCCVLLLYKAFSLTKVSNATLELVVAVEVPGRLT
jgi:hypothetical protein